MAIIERLDVVEDLGASLVVGGEVAPSNEFEFECAPETFHGGVVVAGAAAAHGGNEAGLGVSTSRSTLAASKDRRWSNSPGTSAGTYPTGC